MLLRLAAVAALSLTGTAAAAAPPAPQPVCTVVDERLDELSGLLVADDTSFWAMPDGGRRAAAYRIDRGTCAVTGERAGAIDPYDAEDLAAGPDGELWIGDIGDNARLRSTVAVIVLPVDGSPRRYRLAYPDGAHDAEALVVDGAGRPVIVTKEGGFGAGVYRTADPLPVAPADDADPIPLERIGGVSLPVSDGTSGPLGALGSRTVTGAAVTSDGRVVALRSYTDAWLYPVTDGDVATAVTGSAVRVPLPAEPQGEAIAFGPDGTLYSGSEARAGVRGEVRAVPGAAGLVGDPAAARPPAGASDPGVPQDPGPRWSPAVIGGGVAVALLLLLAGAMTVRGRRRR